MSPVGKGCHQRLTLQFPLQAFMGELESLLAEAVNKAKRLQAQLQKLGTPVAAHREAPQDAPHGDAPEEENAPHEDAPEAENAPHEDAAEAENAPHEDAPEAENAPHEDAPEAESAPWSSPQARAAAVETLLMTLVGKEAYTQAQQQALGASPAARREALHYVPLAVARGRAFALQRREEAHAAGTASACGHDQSGHVRMTCACCYLGGKFWSWVCKIL